MATYLVTGGAGFIGSHLVEALRARGDGVRVLDDFSTGSRANVPADVEIVEADVSDAHAVRHAMADVDGCFHLAAIASVQRATEDWIGAHRVNLGGSISVFDAARARDGGSPKPVVFASSAAVYGASANLPLREAEPPRPLSAYGADKLGSELHGAVAARLFGVPTTGMRFFNVYGPRQDPSSPYSGVISIFAQRIARGDGVTINGDGLQTRDFVFVRDVARALLAAMDSSTPSFRVFNVCTGRATTLLELADMLMASSGRRVEVRHGPERAGDIRASVGDPAELRAGVGVEAATPVAAGLAETMAWMKA